MGQNNRKKEAVFLIVLGIDPGYALMGWGVVEAQGSRMKLINYGCIETKAGVPMQHRLRALQIGVKDLSRLKSFSSPGT